MTTAITTATATAATTTVVDVAGGVVVVAVVLDTPSEDGVAVDSAQVLRAQDQAALCRLVAARVRVEVHRPPTLFGDPTRQLAPPAVE